MAQVDQSLFESPDPDWSKPIRFIGQAGLDQLTGACGFSATPPDSFRAELNHSMLGDQFIDSFRATPYRCERTPQRIAEYPFDLVQLGFPRTGSFTLTQEGRIETIEPGYVGFFRSSLPYAYETTDVTSIVQVAVPAVKLPPHLRSLRAPRPVAFVNSPVAEAFAALVSTLTKAIPAPDSAESAYLQQALIDICVAVVTEAIDGHPTPLADDGMRFRVRGYIQQHLGDPGLGPQSIADDLNMSVRYLHRLFSDEEQTVGKYIRSVRLASVADELKSPRAAQTFSTLATRYGFRGPDQLARAFRAAYGMNMSDYRELDTPPNP
jgi:AraC-like DNA-binding protein